MIVPLALRWRAFYATRLMFCDMDPTPLNADTVFEFTQSRASCIYATYIPFSITQLISLVR